MFDATIPAAVLAVLQPIFYMDKDAANDYLADKSGIIDFFETEDDFFALCAHCAQAAAYHLAQEDDRAAYGDFQTSAHLAAQICELVQATHVQPQTIIEPTCGKGSFILAVLHAFSDCQTIIGIEIHKPYIWQAKFSILHHYTIHQIEQKPAIYLYHSSIFDVPLAKLPITGSEILVLGNPPWVTNAMLSVLDSDNLPRKANTKQAAGFDAMTGKSNFDLGESISYALLDVFQQYKGVFAFLVKSTVVKNILHEQPKARRLISSAQKYTIDSQKEFGAATDAALFMCRLGKTAETTCEELDFYTRKTVKRFGWANGKFVSNIEKYAAYAGIDGECAFEWRQGVKHDCAKVMELDHDGEAYQNGNGEGVAIETELIYPLLKSSDLTGNEITSTRKYVLITQQKIGQDTQPIADLYPKTWAYLQANKAALAARKSSIYKGKPAFSIFGIGDYSFAPYKVAISGLYKKSVFSLIPPNGGKPVMLDDTCYFIGFDEFKDALITQTLLNSEAAQGLLQAIVFWDGKRVITKDILQRLNISSLASQMSFAAIHALNPHITEAMWQQYQARFAEEKQLNLF